MHAKGIKRVISRRLSAVDAEFTGIAIMTILRMTEPTTPPRKAPPIKATILTTIVPPTRRYSVVEPRYARYCSPKFQAEFGVAEEEPDGPFQGFVQGRRQGLGYHVLILEP